MSTNRIQRIALVTLEATIVLATLAAAALALIKPACIDAMLESMVHGLGGGLLLALVKIISQLRQLKPELALPASRVKPVAVISFELQNGLLAGFLLGLALAMSVFITC